MKTKYFLCFFFFLIVCILNKSVAQKQGQALIDSLQMRLKNYKTFCNDKCIKDSNKILIITALAWEYCNKKPDSAAFLINEALTLSTQIHWDIGSAMSYNTEGWLNNNQGKNLAAIECYKKALNLWNSIINPTEKNKNNFIRMSNVLLNLGLSYANLHKYDSALSCDFKALKIVDELNYEIGKAKIYSNMGIIYRRQYDYQKALDYCFKALEINKKYNNKESEAKNLGNIANIYDNLNDPQNGLKYLLMSAKINEDLNNKQGLAIQYTNISKTFIRIGEYPQTLDYSNRAIKLYGELKNQVGIAESFQLIGEVL